MTKVAQVSIAIAVIAVGAVLLFCVEPARVWFLPKCMFHELTGMYCPGCGMTRATHHLLHGHILTALHCNAIFTLALPCVVAYGIWRWTGQPERALSWRPVYVWLLLGVVAVFGIVRNIPIHPFTLLAP